MNQKNLSVFIASNLEVKKNIMRHCYKLTDYMQSVIKHLHISLIFFGSDVLSWLGIISDDIAQQGIHRFLAANIRI